MSRTHDAISVSRKERASELGHRSEPHQQFRRAFNVQAGYLLCDACGAIGFQKHWYINPDQQKILNIGETTKHVLCPGCQRAADKDFEGEVILCNSGAEHEMGEVVALILHTEGKCWHHNPFARIADVTQQEGKIHIYTTTRFLAERIGKELRKAFKGTLDVKRTPEEQYVRVYWRD